MNVVFLDESVCLCGDEVNMKYYNCYLHLQTNVPGQLYFSVAFLIKSVMVSNLLQSTHPR